MNTSKKCAQCGLVNFAMDDLCRRCSADLDAPAPALTQPLPTSSKSTVYLCLFVLFLAGLGVWGYWHKQRTDRELREKAEWMRIQNDYAGQGVNIPPAGAATPTTQGSRADQMKRVQGLMEEINKREDEQRALRERALKESRRPPE